MNGRRDAKSRELGGGEIHGLTRAGRLVTQWGSRMLVPTFLAVASCWAGEDGMRWRWSNPTPHGNNIVAMAYSVDLGLAVQVTERGGLYTSRDMTTWIPRESGTRKALRAAAFLGPRLVITGEEGTLLYADSEAKVMAGALLDGPTVDWLEGCAASAEQAVAVGDNGAIYTSADGEGWRRQQSGTTAWLRGVAHGAGTWVAVGEGGTILKSTDGIQWSTENSGTSAHLNHVKFTGDAFVAVGDGGVVRISENGVVWRAQSANATNDLLGVGSSGNVRLLVGDEEVRRFEENAWFDELGGTRGPPPWVYYSVLGGSQDFLIGGQTGLMVHGQRMELGNWEWQPHSPSVRNWLFDMTYVSNLFVAVGDRGTVMTSSGGVDWDLEVVPDSLTNAVLLGVGGTPDMLVAAGNQGSLMISHNNLTNLVWTNELGTILTQEVSTLGIVWQAIEPRPATNDLQGVTYHNGRYYVSGDQGLVLSTEDGMSWVRHQTPTTALLSGITGFPGGLIATGNDGALVYSSEGTEWVALPTLTTNWLYRVRNVNGTLFAVGQEGSIYRSSNAIDWELSPSGVTRWLNDVSWVDGRYYIAGTQGAVLSSEDGMSWVTEEVITPKSLFTLATNGSYLLVAGVEGVILRSPIVPDLTPVKILDFSRVFKESGTAYQNLFLLGGRVDQRFTLDYRESLGVGAWTTGREIEFSDSSGTLYYIETVPTTNATVSEYYRATLIP